MDRSSSYVFVSYASVDRPAVLQIVSALRDSGLDVWIDLEDITGGTQYGSEIGDGIRGCTAFVLMCTPASLSSRNVRQEIMLAWKYGRPYLPLLLESITIPPDLEYWLEGAQWIEVFDYSEELWLPRILTAVERFAQEQILRSGPDTEARKAGPRVRTNLPPASPLVGRVAEIHAIEQVFSVDGERLVTLTGAGGVGKTRLAIAVATRYATAVDQVIFVPLESVSDVGLVPAAIARAAGIPLDETLNWTEQLSAAFADEQTLLVLDNLEHLSDIAAVIEQLLAACPNVTILATSRARLGLDTEREFPVSPLAVPNLAKLPAIGKLARIDAVDLFIRRARLLRPEFQLTDENAAAVAALCVRLDGLPLAIELAAARIRLFTPQAMLDRLSTTLPLLTGGARTQPERQQTLRNTIAWSYDLLSETEQRIYRQISPFRADWSLEAAEAVAGTSDAPNLDVLTGLEQLVEHSLLRQHEVDGDVRFSMLETIREFGQEQLTAAGESIDTHQRLAEYYKAFLEETRRRARDEGASDSMVRIGREYDNIRVAIRHSLTHDHVMAMQFCDYLPAFWDGWGNAHEGYGIVREALQYLPEVPLDYHAGALICAGIVATRVYDYEAARVYLSQAREAAVETGNVRYAATSLITLGNVAGDSGDYDQAIGYYEEAIPVCRELGEDHRLNLCYLNLGVTYLDSGQYTEAVPWLSQCVDLACALGNLSTEAYARMNLALALVDLGDFESAEPLFAKAIALCRQLHIRTLLANSLVGLGDLYTQQGKYAQARQCMFEAVPMLRELNDTRSMALTLPALTRLIVRVGHRDEGVEILDMIDHLRVASRVVLDSSNQKTYEQLRRETRSEPLPVSEVTGAPSGVTLDAAMELALQLIAPEADVLAPD